MCGATSGHVRLVNAGHMPPIRITGEAFHDLAHGNMALGMMPGASTTSRDLDLQAGDMLVIYSDGLTEALNEAGDFYGDDRMRALSLASPFSAGDAGRACWRRSMPSSATRRLRRPLAHRPETHVGVGTIFDHDLPATTIPSWMRPSYNPVSQKRCQR